MNCDPCSQVVCPLATNDCHLAGSCQGNGICSPQTALADGSPCNSIPFGVCRSGQCSSLNASVIPYPSTAPAVASPATVSTLRPTLTSSMSMIPFSISTRLPSSASAPSCTAFCGAYGHCNVGHNNCTCNAGWTGPICDQQPCASQTCSGHGTCSAVGDTDWRCTCVTGYTGRTCSNSCDSFGCATSTYPYTCAWWQDSPPVMRLCLRGTEL